jgi:phage recombination protein Bet
MSNVTTLPANPPPKLSLLVEMATRYGMDHRAFEQTIRATVMPKGATTEELAAFLLVARQYNLNPITREIYAFTNRGAIVPIVSIDGWMNLINSHPAFDGMEFEEALTDKGEFVSTTCRIYRKDRGHPIAVTEWLSECYRPTEAWKMRHRMLRHKSAIQCARYAFGFAGIYDEDEAERFATRIQHSPPPPPPEEDEPPTPPTPPIVTKGFDTSGKGDYVEGPPTPPPPPAAQQESDDDDESVGDVMQQGYDSRMAFPDLLRDAVPPEWRNHPKLVAAWQEGFDRAGYAQDESQPEDPSFDGAILERFAKRAAEARDDDDLALAWADLVQPNFRQLEKASQQKVHETYRNRQAALRGG